MGQVDPDRRRLDSEDRGTARGMGDKRYIRVEVRVNDAEAEMLEAMRSIEDISVAALFRKSMMFYWEGMYGSAGS